MKQTNTQQQYNKKRCDTARARPRTRGPRLAARSCAAAQNILDYLQNIREHPDMINSYLRNERAMEIQKRHMNTRSLSNHML